ncbi:MAG: aminoacyl-tRNA hydrolase [Treponema sp.]|jgi:PTH1 family peptidyl-tRNA hydrolase|nr:aminoacyl-tRNA hydrolase [Treponema sp.]
MIQLAVFLGNPGPEYAGNRHNAGRLLAARLPFYGSMNWQKKYKGLYAAFDRSRLPAPGASAVSPENPAETAPGPKIHFLLPETYMNRSGESVLAAAAFFKVPPDQILVVHDELELPLGTLSLKFSGGLGGHNGLRSMKASFGTADFWRLRIGIGRPDDRTPGQGGPPGSGRGVIGWVLSDFSAAEEEILAPVLEAGAGLLLRALRGEPEQLLPEWRKKKAAPDE